MGSQHHCRQPLDTFYNSFMVTSLFWTLIPSKCNGAFHSSSLFFKFINSEISDILQNIQSARHMISSSHSYYSLYFVLFNDIWPQKGHSVSCLFCLQITNFEIKPSVNEQSAWWLHMATLIFLRGLCRYVWVITLSVSAKREHEDNY